MRHPTTPCNLLAALALASGLLLLPLFGAGAKTASFVFSDIDGRPVHLADYRGQWLLVAFWAPWCPLCRIQMPALKELDARADLSVLGVGLDYDHPDTLRATADRLGLPYRIVPGGSRRAPDSPHLQVGPVFYFPTSYLYAPAGEQVMHFAGQIDVGKLLAFMENRRAGPAYAFRTERLAAWLQRTYGAAGERAYADWRALVDRAGGLDDAASLAAVNDFFNRRIAQDSDRHVWGRPDYWTTLGELLGKGAGDGEDFAIAKYFTLRALGVPDARLRLVYARATGAARPNGPVHLVLAWFPAGGRDPLLLDNRDVLVKPASLRADLKPVFSFNGAESWSDTQEAAPARPMWVDVLRRAREEGFE